jgi:four helix bundle protein
MKQNIVQEKSFEFALKSIDLYKSLLAKNEFVLSNQFFKSATSIGANIEEAIGAFSKKEFAAKMGISYKEARETLYWLRIIEASKFVDHDLQYLEEESRQLISILSSIVKSTRENM